jgi:flagellar FliL protein
MAQAEKLDLGEEKPAPSSSKKLIFVAIGAILVTLIAVFATLYFLGIFPPKHDKAATAGHGKEAATAAHGKEADKGEEESDKEDGEHGAEAHPVIYEALTPAFVVNFKGNPEVRVVQIEITAASKDKAILDALKKHAPMLRNNVLMIISAQDPTTFKTVEGKEALRSKIKDEIKNIVVEQTDKKVGVDELYFTGFVMQ